MYTWRMLTHGKVTITFDGCEIYEVHDGCNVLIPYFLVSYFIIPILELKPWVLVYILSLPILFIIWNLGWGGMFLWTWCMSNLKWPYFPYLHRGFLTPDRFHSGVLIPTPITLLCRVRLVSSTPDPTIIVRIGLV